MSLSKSVCSASVLPLITTAKRGLASVDYNLSNKDSLRGRFILNRIGSIDSTGFPSTFYQTIPTNSYLATFSEFHTFTPAVVNEFRFGYNRNSTKLSGRQPNLARPRSVPEYRHLRTRRCEQYFRS